MTPAYQSAPTPPARSNTGTIIAIIIGVVLFGCVFFGAILAAIMFPVFAKSREKARQSQCMSNVRQSTIAIQMYMQDHNNQFPSKDSVWADVALPPNVLTCPTYGADKGNGYGYNASLSKKSIMSSGMPGPQIIPMLADSRMPGNLLNSPVDIDPRHVGRAIVGFADGHVEMQVPSAVSNLPIP
jgi:prepilin-type processing-associated H-X9-DG protein